MRQRRRRPTRSRLLRRRQPPTTRTEEARSLTTRRWTNRYAARHFEENHGFCIKRQNELFIEVWKLFSQGSTDSPALLSCAMLPRKAGGTHQKQLTNPTAQLTLSIIMNFHSNKCYEFSQEREIIASLEMEEREHQRYTARKSSAAVTQANYENTIVS